LEEKFPVKFTVSLIQQPQNKKSIKKGLERVQIIAVF